MFTSSNWAPISVMIVVLVIPLLSFVGGAPNCPIKCKCNETTVRCVEKQLISIPDFKRITWNPTTIDLSENDIEEVKAVNFAIKKLETLQYLHMDDNSLLSIEATSFSSLPSLQYLDLSNNLLDYVPSDIVKKNLKLTKLNLSGNLFSSKTPKLVSENLHILDLSFSKISTFTQDSLEGLPNLRVLYLHANSLQHVDYNIFLNVKLMHVNLSYNCWKCHCDTIKLFDYLVKSGLTDIDTPIRCMHPNKWYEDIYNSKGPMHNNKLCKKKHHHAQLADSSIKSEVVIPKTRTAKEQEETQIEEDNMILGMEYGAILMVSFGAFVFVVIVISLAAVVSRKTKTPKNHIYEELQNVSINSKQSTIFSEKSNGVA